MPIRDKAISAVVIHEVYSLTLQKEGRDVAALRVALMAETSRIFKDPMNHTRQRIATAVRRLFLFMMVSLDGYFEGPNRDLSWHVVDQEFNRFAVEQLKQIGTLLFGRITYQLFEDYWPKAGRDPAMSSEDLEIARMINDVEKIVFSRTLAKVKEADDWKNIRLIPEAQPEEINRLKQLPGKDIAIFGSNDLATHFLRMGLIDELRIMVNPVVLGNGNPLFRGMTDHVKLNFLRTKTFRSGNVLHCYRPE